MMNHKKAEIICQTVSSLIFFPGGRQLKFENRHNGEKDDAYKSHPADGFQTGGIGGIVENERNM